MGAAPSVAHSHLMSKWVYRWQCAFAYASKVADGIVRPVQSMVQLTRRINSGDFSQDVLDTQANCRELALLFEVFKQMYVGALAGASCVTCEA